MAKNNNSGNPVTLVVFKLSGGNRDGHVVRCVVQEDLEVVNKHINALIGEEGNGDITYSGANVVTLAQLGKIAIGLKDEGVL